MSDQPHIPGATIPGVAQKHDQQARRIFSRRLAQERERAGMTQLELGRRLGLAGRSAISTISRMEAGEALPSLERLFRLAEIFGVEPWRLLRD